MRTEQSTHNRRTVLSSLWIFFIFNILYADVLTLMEGAGKGAEISVDGSASMLSAEMLLGAAIILEAAFVMIILCRVAKYQLNRRANIAIALFQALVVAGSLFVAVPAIYYMFFAAVEIATLLFIVWYAWTWSEAPVMQQSA